MTDYRKIEDLSLEAQAAMRGEAPEPTEVERLRDFVKFVEEWTRHPVGHYSMMDLNVLLSETRAKIAALK